MRTKIKGIERERKHNKKRYGMRVSGKSVFVIQEELSKRPKRKGRSQ